MEKYGGKFPLWVIIEFFSMGMLSYFYSTLKCQVPQVPNGNPWNEKRPP